MLTPETSGPGARRSARQRAAAPAAAGGGLLAGVGDGELGWVVEADELPGAAEQSSSLILKGAHVH